jgi:hypothetical protein
MSNTETLTIMKKKAGNIQNEKKLQKKQAEKLLREGNFNISMEADDK